MAKVTKQGQVVSVPLRGKYCRELRVRSPKLRRVVRMFPSPCGVNIVGNKDAANAARLAKAAKQAAKGFRPLAG